MLYAPTHASCSTPAGVPTPQERPHACLAPVPALAASLGGAKQGERLRAPLCSIVLASLVDWLVAQAAAALCVLEAATLCARGSSHVCASGCNSTC